ncbi:MAG TPA: FtsX-like permease family protein, partial [Vicinamibacterales bacterium]|nr:FtsX-like permease family protein [Vicinamibacterales bacterium]
LVVAAGLLLRTFTALGSRPLGFDADRTLVVNIDAQRVPADTVPRLLLYDRVRAAAGQVPGVAGAAYSLVTPMQGGGISDQVEVSGGAKLPPALLGGIANVYGNMVSTGWFTALGVRVIAGRDFTADDRTGAPRAAIVNEAFVRTFLGGADPIGRTLKHLRGVQAQIVGVVADSVYGSLREPAPPTFYEPLPQADLPPISLSNVSLTVRAGDRPAAIARSVTAAIEQVSSDVALTVFPLSDQVNAALAQERVTALLASTFGAVALALAGLGVYGVTAYAVARRRAELGIRLALGATPAAVVRLVLSHVALIVAIGVIAGAAASAWAARFIASLLYGLPPRDPATFIGAVATLAAVSTVAAFMPAWRASRIEPAEVLREN